MGWHPEPLLAGTAGTPPVCDTEPRRVIGIFPAKMPTSFSWKLGVSVSCLHDLSAGITGGDLVDLGGAFLKILTE